MKIDEITHVDAVTLYSVIPTKKEIWVGDAFRGFRNGAEIGRATASGVLVGGKVLDHAYPGQSCQLLLRGAKFEAGDVLEPEDK